MTKVVITGGRGFLGRNLAAHLAEREDCQTTIFDLPNSIESLHRALLEADVVFHLAGVNRPQNPGEFESENVGLTEQLCAFLLESRRSPKIVFSSSVQAELDNPYGASKLKAEQVLRQFASQTGAPVKIYRLKNLFGKWCRPNYNSVTATFCHNIANDLPIAVNDLAREIELSYVDDVVDSFLADIDRPFERGDAGLQIRGYRIGLGDLAGRIQAFHEMGTSLTLPDFADWFNRALYATYLSYVPKEARRHDLAIKSDPRGCLAEFIKQKHFGQVFVSRTRPGVTRGNHYHHTKTEKFFVVEGEGLIRMRALESDSVDEYAVSGDAFTVIDIPPGYTHSITNVGACEMVTLFWSSAIFDPNCTDTYFSPVDPEQQGK